jgi:hypothetical protein
MMRMIALAMIFIQVAATAALATQIMLQNAATLSVEQVIPR